MPYEGESFFEASLGEPMSCIIGGYHANYHTNKQNYDHAMGTKEGGNIIILGGCGPMGLGAVSYGINYKNKPKRIVVTDINDARIARAKEVVSPEYAAETASNSSTSTRPTWTRLMTNSWPSPMATATTTSSSTPRSAPLLNSATASWPLTDASTSSPARRTKTSALNQPLRLPLHQHPYHGTTGGNNNDLIEANTLAAKGIIDPAVMVTHVGGIDSIAETTLNLPNIPGGKKLAYTQFNMPMTAIEDFAKLGEKDPFFLELDKCCKAHKGLWNGEAEKMILKHFNVEI